MRILISIKKNRQSRTKGLSQKGFTMVELMTVCVIIGILASMSFVLLSRARRQVVETNALSALNALATAYEMYYYHNGKYPHWGPEADFASPKEIWDMLVAENYLPQSCSKIYYDPANGYIYGYTQDYAVEILPYSPSNPLEGTGSYFIVFHPLNFQRDALAIGHNPPTGWVAVRARRGPEGADPRTYGLFVFRRD